MKKHLNNDIFVKCKFMSMDTKIHVNRFISFINYYKDTVCLHLNVGVFVAI